MVATDSHTCLCGCSGHALIGDVIDTDQEEGMLVAAGVSDTLDSLKRTYAGLPDFLTQVVNAELARVPRHLSDALADQLWSIVYMPQARCVTVPTPCLACLFRSHQSLGERFVILVGRKGHVCICIS